MTDRLIHHTLISLFLSAISATVMSLNRQSSYTAIEDWIDIQLLDLALPDLPSEFEGYRVVHISDFHIGTWINRERLMQAMDLVNSQNPDLVAITGDFVTYNPEKYAGDLIDSLRRLTPHDGTFAIMGNHDHWAGVTVIRKILSSAGVIELQNSFQTLYRGNASLHICGIDDQMKRLDRLELITDKLPEQGPAILLAHEPDFADRSAATGRFGLQLSGHTHGGQVRFPWIGPIFLPRLGRKYPMGLYRVKDMYQYTNRGLGTAELQLRFNCPAEIAVFRLLSRPARR